jgi:hypothetical protein
VLPIEVLVLEEQDGILGLEGAAQEAYRVLGARRESDEETRGMGEDRLAALGMPDGASSQVTADRRAHDQRAGKRPVRPPADRGCLAAKLMHCGPDVVEELDLGAGPKATQRLAYSAPDDVRLGQGSVVGAGGAEASLKPTRHAEDPTFALDAVKDLVVGISDVLAEHLDALIGLEQLVEGESDGFCHHHRRCVRIRWRRIGLWFCDDRQPHHVRGNSGGVRALGSKGLVGSARDDFTCFEAQVRRLGFADKSASHEGALERVDRVVCGFFG